MTLTDFSLYRTRNQIVGEMLAELQAAIPDIYMGDDGIIRIIYEIESGQLENVFLANQLLAEDMWVQSASLQALGKFGEQYGISQREGSRSTGQLIFTAAGGETIPAGTQAAHDPGFGLDPVYFESTDTAVVPDTGTPVAPVVAVNATAGNLNGLYEYVVTYLSAAGETLPSVESAAVNPVSQQVNLTNIPLGGPGTIGRRIYRDKNGAGIYRRVTEIADNTTTMFTDNVTDTTVASSSLAPSVDTAHAIQVAARAVDPGTEGNVIIGSITEIVSGPGSISAVNNPVAFAGGSDSEDSDDFRARILDFLQNPQTGSVGDLKAWAEEVEGVGTATVIANDNLGTPTNGHVTVRIAGPNGEIPDADVQADVLEALQEQDIANITIHVGTFTPVVQNVTVDVTTSGTYVLADVTPSVQQAIADYITTLQVGDTLRISGIVDAVFGLVGILDVTVTSPTSNQTVAAMSKLVPGTITVT
jgi:uncharacterized phage protein gp47/JayE